MQKLPEGRANIRSLSRDMEEKSEDRISGQEEKIQLSGCFLSSIVRDRITNLYSDRIPLLSIYRT